VKTIYDKSSGSIRAVGTFDVAANLRAGEAAFDGAVDPDRFLIIDGKPVPKPEPKIDVRDWIRERRKGLLDQSDWTQSPDSPLTADKRAEWARYRKELRDLTDTQGHHLTVSEVRFPDPPS
tara:strand:- start:945 stop:1307 length:363 start_codon:yes stop_codon:yes gene_type:complete